MLLPAVAAQGRNRLFRRRDEIPNSVLDCWEITGRLTSAESRISHRCLKRADPFPFLRQPRMRPDFSRKHSLRAADMGRQRRRIVAPRQPQCLPPPGPRQATSASFSPARTNGTGSKMCPPGMDSGSCVLPPTSSRITANSHCVVSNACLTREARTQVLYVMFDRRITERRRRFS